MGSELHIHNSISPTQIVQLSGGKIESGFMAETSLFEIDDLHVSSAPGANQPAVSILEGVSLTIAEGEVHALLGPSGSGKSTLASTLMGSTEYEVTGGRILFGGDDITYWDTDVRAKAGMFLAFQHPQEIAGASVLDFLRQSVSARKGLEMSVLELRDALSDWMDRLGMDQSFMERHVNEGFSCGEKKRNEILQMTILDPAFAILDETDAGLDLDALRSVANGVQELREDRPAFGALVIANDHHLLDHLAPDHVHIMIGGRVVRSGGLELAASLERDGYESFR